MLMIHVFHHIRVPHSAATFDPTGANLPCPDLWKRAYSRELRAADVFDLAELAELEAGRPVVRKITVTVRTVH